MPVQEDDESEGEVEKNFDLKKFSAEEDEEEE